MARASLILSVICLWQTLLRSQSQDHCSGPHHEQPCDCSRTPHGCRLNLNSCMWTSTECVSNATSSTATTTELADPMPLLTCGDEIDNVFDPLQEYSFALEIASDTSFIAIDACQCNFDSLLRLYDTQWSDVPINTDDDSCTNHAYHASVIERPSGLHAGAYRVVLSAQNVSNVMANSEEELGYSLRIYCESEFDGDGEEMYNYNLDAMPGIDTTATTTTTTFEDDCESDCDAFSVELAYYGALSEYDTNFVYYEDIEQSVPVTATHDESHAHDADIMCYTYRVARDCGTQTLQSIVLGVCATDEGEDLQDLLVSEYGGDTFSVYHTDADDDAGSGIQVHMSVEAKPMEFTLCMRGVNDEGVMADVVRFLRTNGSSYMCSNEGVVRHHGLPCLRQPIVEVAQVSSTQFADDVDDEDQHEISNGDITEFVMHESHSPQPRGTSTALLAVLMGVFAVMVSISLFYMCVSHDKSWLHAAVRKYKWNLNINGSGFTTGGSSSSIPSQAEDDSIESTDFSFSSSSHDALTFHMKKKLDQQSSQPQPQQSSSLLAPNSNVNAAAVGNDDNSKLGKLSDLGRRWTESIRSSRFSALSAMKGGAEMQCLMERSEEEYEPAESCTDLDVVVHHVCESLATAQDTKSMEEEKQSVLLERHDDDADDNDNVSSLSGTENDKERAASDLLSVFDEDGVDAGDESSIIPCFDEHGGSGRARNSAVCEDVSVNVINAVRYHRSNTTGNYYD